MKNYEKPVVLVNEELAEGVYAASGATGTADCWSYDVKSVQDWDGGSHVFEIYLTHHTNLEHISNGTTVSVTFSAPLAEPSRAEFDYSISGSTITITRELLADAYNDGDKVTYKIWASTGDEATTKAIYVKSVNMSCDKAINVQGGGADEL